MLHGIDPVRRSGDSLTVSEWYLQAKLISSSLAPRTFFVQIGIKPSGIKTNEYLPGDPALASFATPVPDAPAGIAVAWEFLSR